MPNVKGDKSSTFGEQTQETGLVEGWYQYPGQGVKRLGK